MKIVIIVPTYNEAENIRRLVPALVEITDGLDHQFQILVVDDYSPDGTADVVRELQQSNEHLFLLEGEKRGLGSAYVRGMTYAIDQLDADAIYEFDADFSHDPNDIPRLLTNLEHGADFVIGSRYVPGGTIPDEWPFWRKANSYVGNLVARILVGLGGVRDCTAGFRCIRTDLLKRIDLESLNVQGYAFQVALLHAAVREKASIVEVPVNFVDRRVGESKLGLRDIIEFVVNAWWLRFQASKVFIKFLIVGASGVLVNLGVFTLLINNGVNLYLASPIAIEVSIITNFFLNNVWTFSSRSLSDRTSVRGLKFNAVSILALIVSYTTFIALSFLFPDKPPQLHQAIAIVPAALFNYLLNSYWTFRSRSKAE